MRIDTGALIACGDPRYNVEEELQLIRNAASELRRLYALEDATTPFKDRAEVETYLKGKGWEKDSDWRWWRKRNAGMQMAIFDHDTLSITKDPDELDVNAPDFGNFPYDLLTPALLDAILEAK